MTQISNVQSFRGNSVYDPDLTGIGTQPLFFDQYALVYERYLVSSSSMRVMVMSINNGITAQIATLPSVESSPVTTNPSDLKEQPHAKFRFIQEQKGGGKATLSTRISTKKIRGDSILDDSFGAQVTTNPQRQWFWHIVASAGDLSAEVIGLTLLISITYRVKFHKRVNPAKS